MNIEFTFRDLDVTREALEYFMKKIKDDDSYYSEMKKHRIKQCSITLNKVRNQFQVEHDLDPMHEGGFYTSGKRN
jgi:hypothetical protein